MENLPIVAPVMAITKSPPCTIKSLATSILSVATWAQVSRFKHPCSISPIRITFVPSSCHHALLNANPDFTAQ